MLPSFISKWILYYPVTILKGELHLRYFKAYRNYEQKPIEQIRKTQKDQLLSIISYAKKNTDFYRSRYRYINIEDLQNLSLQEILLSLPTVRKQDLIESGLAMKATTNVFTSTKTTGGSTGQPVTLLKNADALARERVATNIASRWSGLNV